MGDINRNETPPQTPVYLVLGANGSLGCSVATRLLNRGARVVLAGRNAEELALIADSVDTDVVLCEATDFTDMHQCIQTSKEIHGRLDGVVNCVGSIVLKPAHLTSEDEWDSVLATNLTSSFATVKYASKAMMGSGGSIVLVSSCAAQVGLQNHEAIAAAKAGIEGLVRAAAATYARHGVRVNCVAPGLFKSKLSAPFISNSSQLQTSVEMHPLGRIGEPGDVAQVIAWLLSEESSWVTGQSISVDGGVSTVRPVKRGSTQSVVQPVAQVLSHTT